MELYPAVDIRDGRVVRAAGPSAPLEVARRFVTAGASWIHVVDLDAVFGTGDNLNLVCELCRIPEVLVQVGGNLADVSRVQAVVGAGASRVVFGTGVGRDADALAKLVEAAGHQAVAVALETCEGKMFVRDENRIVDQPLRSYVERVVECGIRTVVVRDVKRDGSLAGADLSSAASVRGLGASIIYGGGVESLDEVRAARAADLHGMIVGRALLDGRFSLEEALACLR